MPRPPRPKKPKPAAAASPSIRMYRQGLGDCFLITLPRSDGSRPFRIMIDCGVILGTPGAAARMRDVADDILRESGGKVDLLIVTHEHWDHLSGFIQAKDILEQIKFGAVWMGWTESGDDQAKRLRADRSKAQEVLRLTEARLRLHALSDSADDIGGLLDFFGAAGGTTTDAMEVARRLAGEKPPHYAEPGEPPTELTGTGARLYVLGPPRDETFLLRSDPSRAHPETYGFGLSDFPMEDVEAALGQGGPTAPFGPRTTIPLEVARAMPQFRGYFADGPTGAGEGESWRRIDAAWLDGATNLALKLDHDTNNTSLAVAIELAQGDVLLFVADAQVGNWLSWAKLKWTTASGAVTGPDLLARTVFYKVGHHGSHNATLREQGLELMRRLRCAAIPVDEAMAKRKRWNRMPLAELLDRLEKKIPGGILRSDQPAPPGLANITADPLYFDIAL